MSVKSTFLLIPLWFALAAVWAAGSSPDGEAKVKPTERDSVRSAPRLYRGPPNKDPILNGKSVVVRIYHGDYASPDEFVRRTFVIRDFGLDISHEDGSEGDVLLLAAVDQVDEEISRLLGPVIHVGAFTNRFPVPPQLPHQRGRRHLVDALGGPIPAGELQLTLLLSKPEHQYKTFTLDFMIPITFDGSLQDDENRDLLPRISTKSLHIAGWIARHPSFGNALIRRTALRDEGPIRVPLVRHGTLADERALQGQILTWDDRPVAYAQVIAKSVRTPGEGLIQGPDAAVISDQTGFFRLYYPGSERSPYRGRVIPPGSRYFVNVTAPNRYGLLPHSGEYYNDEPAIVRLEEGDAFHTFAFLTDSGQIEEKDVLERLRLSYRPLDRDALQSLPNEFLVAGGMVLYGDYHTEYWDGSVRRRFSPVTVTPSSPEDLVFS